MYQRRSRLRAPRINHPRFGEVKIRDRGRLPHWEIEGGVYSVNFRLADSLPESALRSFEFERNDIVRTAEQQGRELSASERKRLDELFSERIDAYLDRGAGACHLRNPEIASMVAGALGFFEGTRYRLFTWCVMPNHVHVVFKPLQGYSLDQLLHSWKSFTAQEANKLLGTHGVFWQPEYYDHLIRGEEEFYRAVEYVALNPVKAGLKEWKWVWVRDRGT